MLKPAKIERQTPEALGEFRQEVKFEVVTPMFGGGVFLNEDAPHQKEPDAVTPIRSAAVRGQLRFWWRATTGVTYGNIPAMKKAEDELWGNASIAGKVRLHVQYKGTPTTKPVYQWTTKQDGKQRLDAVNQDLAYGAFPLQPAQQASNKTPGNLHRFSGEATLTLSGPAGKQQEVMGAVQAWLTFGGLGGRTRRGFGAVSSKGSAVDPEKVLGQWKGSPLAGCSSLAGGRLAVLGKNFGSAEDAQLAGLKALRMYRQGVGVGRNPGQQPSRPGRSRWPEPDEIRRLKMRHDFQHAPMHPVHKFPRAAFGMPIIFHFQSKDDPKDTQLVPEGLNRRASPLILRPVQTAGGWKVLALVLSDPAMRGELQSLSLSGDPVRGELTRAEAQQIRPLSENQGTEDVLGSFLTYFRAQ
jgi:CRISPR-associated protein Cmr1